MGDEGVVSTIGGGSNPTGTSSSSVVSSLNVLSARTDGIKAADELVWFTMSESPATMFFFDEKMRCARWCSAEYFVPEERLPVLRPTVEAVVESGRPDLFLLLDVLLPKAEACYSKHYMTLWAVGLYNF